MTTSLFKRGFLSLLVTQFFGATNDNILKQVLIFMVSTGVWRGQLGSAGEGWVAMAFTVPFILFSGYGGQFADRNSKQRVAVLLKILEIPIVMIAGIGLWTHNLPVTFFSLLLLSVHSTFFGPAKYGMIPELVDEGNLSRANGTINMLTNIAVIAGTLLAGPISDVYFPATIESNGQSVAAGAGVPWIPGAAMLAIAAFGLLAALLLPRLTARDPKMVYELNPFTTYVKSVREMAAGPMLMVAIAWSYFYIIASISLLILPEYKAILGIDYTWNSYLLGALAVAIGVGCFVAGLISGHRIEPRLVPVGGVGMFFMFVLLGAITPEYWSVMAMLIVAGVFAGFFIVPLQALLQKLAPADERGRFLGTANAMSFLAFMLGAGTELIAAGMFKMPHNRVFLIVAGLALIGTIYMLWHMRAMRQPRPAAAPNAA